MVTPYSSGSSAAYFRKFPVSSLLTGNFERDWFAPDCVHRHSKNLSEIQVERRAGTKREHVSFCKRGRKPVLDHFESSKEFRRARNGELSMVGEVRGGGNRYLSSNGLEPKTDWEFGYHFLDPNGVESIT